MSCVPSMGCKPMAWSGPVWPISVCVSLSLQGEALLWSLSSPLIRFLYICSISSQLLCFIPTHLPCCSPLLHSLWCNIILLSLLLYSGWQMDTIIQFSPLFLRGDFLLKTQHSVVVPQCIIMVMKAIIIQLGLSGVWRRFFWKLGGRGMLAGCSVSQSERRDKEGEGGCGTESKRENWRTGGREGGREGRVMKRMVCVCKTVSTPFARSTVSASLTAWKTALVKSATIRTLFSYSTLTPSKDWHKYRTLSNIKVTDALKQHYLIIAIMLWKS